MAIDVLLERLVLLLLFTATTCSLSLNGSSISLTTNDFMDNKDDPEKTVIMFTRDPRIPIEDKIKTIINYDLDIDDEKFSPEMKGTSQAKITELRKGLVQNPDQRFNSEDHSFMKALKLEDWEIKPTMTSHYTPRERRDVNTGIVQNRRLNIKNASKDSYLSSWGTYLSSSGPVATIVNKYLNDCSLAIFYETETASAALALRRSLGQTPCKMFLMTPDSLLKKSTWTMSQCDGYIVLLPGKGHFTRHASIDHYFQTPYKGSDDHPPHYWNYRAKFIILILNQDLGTNSFTTDSNNSPIDQSSPAISPQLLVGLYNFKKTENLLILQPSDEFMLMWTNVFFTKNSMLKLIDRWSNDRFLKSQDPFPDKFRNLNGATVKVSTFEHAPSVMYEKDSEGRIMKRLGVDMGIVLGLAQAKNFTIEFIEVATEEKWGTKNPNGTWDGLMRDVLYEYVDFGVCNVFEDHFRWKEVDFSFPYNFMPACFVAPSPKPLVNWQSPLLPFAWNTWISILASFLIGGFVLYLVSYLSHNPESHDFNSLAYDYLYILGSITLKAMVVEPRYNPSRLFLGFLWIFCLIISTAYSANLIAFLSVVKMTEPVDTVTQLVESGLRIGGHSFWKTQFSVATEKAVLELVDKLESEVDFFTVFNEVERGLFAFVENRQFLELQVGARFTYAGYPTIRLGKQCLINFNIGIILPRKSPLTLSLTKDLLHIYESGIMTQWQEEVVTFYRQEFLTKLSSKTIDDTRTKPLKLDQLQGMFYLLGLGCLLALLILLSEYILKRQFSDDAK